MGTRNGPDRVGLPGSSMKNQGATSIIVGLTTGCVVGVALEVVVVAEALVVVVEGCGDVVGVDAEVVVESGG
ncbi:MAG: hypothetical protein DWQ40_07010 [Actinobacteria bacterium]|nr:MAG: hypothetical protein DWQ40_07010 [Actinomycetota bacterium]